MKSLPQQAPHIGGILPHQKREINDQIDKNRRYCTASNSLTNRLKAVYLFFPNKFDLGDADQQPHSRRSLLQCYNQAELVAIGKTGKIRLEQPQDFISAGTRGTCKRD